MSIAHTAHVRVGTRGGVRGGLRISGCRRRVVVGEARGGGVLELPEKQQPSENEARLPATRTKAIQKVRRLGFLERARWPFSIAMRPLAGPVGAGVLFCSGCFSTHSVRPSASRLLISDLSAGQLPGIVHIIAVLEGLVERAVSASYLGALPAPRATTAASAGRARGR